MSHNGLLFCPFQATSEFTEISGSSEYQTSRLTTRPTPTHTSANGCKIISLTIFLRLERDCQLVLISNLLLVVPLLIVITNISIVIVVVVIDVVAVNDFDILSLSDVGCALRFKKL